MADPTIAGSTVTLLEVTDGSFSAVIEDGTLDSGLANVSALGAKAFYLTLGGTISVRNDFFTMAAAIDASRETRSTIAIANVDATLDGNYYATGFVFQRRQTNWVFTVQLVKATF